MEATGVFLGSNLTRPAQNQPPGLTLEASDSECHSRCAQPQTRDSRGADGPRSHPGPRPRSNRECGGRGPRPSTRSPHPTGGKNNSLPSLHRRASHVVKLLGTGLNPARGERQTTHARVGTHSPGGTAGRGLRRPGHRPAPPPTCWDPGLPTSVHLPPAIHPPLASPARGTLEPRAQILRPRAQQVPRAQRATAAVIVKTSQPDVTGSLLTGDILGRGVGEGAALRHGFAGRTQRHPPAASCGGS